MMHHEELDELDKLTPLKVTSINHTPTHIKGKLAPTKLLPAASVTPIDHNVSPDARIHAPSRFPKHACQSPLLQNASRTKRWQATLSAASTSRRISSNKLGSGWFGNEGSLSVSSGTNREMSGLNFV